MLKLGYQKKRKRFLNEETIIDDPFIYFLTACNNQENSNEKDKIITAQNDSVLNELGAVETKKDIDMKKAIKHGPIEIEMTNLKLAKIKVDDESLGLVDGEKEIDALAIKWSIKNTSDKKTNFFDTGSYLVTNDKQQIHSSTFQDTSVDQGLHPGVEQKGELFFVMEKDVQKLKSIDLYLDQVLIGEKVVAESKKITFPIE